MWYVLVERKCKGGLRTIIKIESLAMPAHGKKKRSPPLPKKRLSSNTNSTTDSQSSSNKYDFSRAGPAVTGRAAGLVGRSINAVPSKTLSSTQQPGAKPVIATNVHNSGKTSNGSETSLSGITSAAGQYNSYRFDEANAIQQNKRMMTIHLKDQMFRKLKFITNDAMMVYSLSKTTLCGYVCTEMRVPEYQWAEYWDLMRQPTKKMIEQQRTNATSAIKKGFKGKNPSAR
jgi:hypothetical protein